MPLKDPRKRAEYLRAWHAANPEKARQYQARHRLRGGAKLREYKTRWLRAYRLTETPRRRGVRLRAAAARDAMAAATLSDRYVRQKLRHHARSLPSSVLTHGLIALKRAQLQHHRRINQRSSPK